MPPQPTNAILSFSTFFIAAYSKQPVVMNHPYGDFAGGVVWCEPHIMLYIFDLDGTLIESYMNPKRPFARVAVLPRRIEVLGDLRRQGHKIAIATNQGGVAFGYNTETEVQDKISRALKALGLEDDTFVAVCYSDRRARNPAYNRPADYARRKPSGAMLREAMAAWPEATQQGVLYVGDRPDDESAAQDAGVPFEWEREFFK